MAYRRYSDGDVNLVKGSRLSVKWDCFNCRLNTETNITLHSLQEVHEHLLRHRAKGHAVSDRSIDRVKSEILDVHANDPVWLGTFFPASKSYELPNQLSDTAKIVFERYLLLANAMSVVSTALENFQQADPVPEELTQGHSLLKEKLLRWKDNLEKLMQNECIRLCVLVTEEQSIKGVDYLIKLFTSDDIYCEPYGGLLRTLEEFPAELWQEQLLDHYSSIPVSKALETQGLLFILDEPEKYHDTATLRSIFDRWSRELERIIKRDPPPVPEENPEDPTEELLRSVFFRFTPTALLKQLKAAAGKLED